MNMKRIKKEKIRIHRHYQPVNYFGKGGSRFFSDSKVRPLRGFWEKSSSPEAPVFSRKILHCRGADLLEPVE